MKESQVTAGGIASTGRAGLTVLVGSAAGYGVALVLTPFLSRLYTPSEFGTFSGVAAVSAVFVGLSTFRLEVLAQRTAIDGEAENLRRIALVSALGWGLVVSLGCGVAVLLTETTPYLLAAGPLVSFASLQLVGSARLVRERRYRELARANLIHGGMTAMLQVCLGVVSATVTTLFVGLVAARLSWLPVLRNRSPRDPPTGSFSPLSSVWRQSRRYAVVSGSAAGLNSLASQLPLLLCTFLYGQAEVGFLAMAIRVLVSPLSIVGQAAAAASIGEIGEHLRAGTSAVDALVRRGMGSLLVLGVLPCALAAVIGPRIVPALLGPSWAPAGPLVGWLALGALAQFAVAPFSQLLNLTGHHGWMLSWDASRLVVVAGAMVLPAALGHPLEVAVAAYSVGSVVLYAVLGSACIRAVRS